MPERHLGRTLGRYRVDEVVGSGGFAWVYKGYDPELDIPVALKVLKPQFAGDQAFEERFRREASTAAKLRHPNIIKIYTVGRQDDAVFFAMDFLPNGLADRLEASNVLPEEFVIRVGMDVASALGFAHREGVIHRDIKVDNILFDPHGNAVVADFGIARAVSGYSGNTGTNMVVGTPQYFAPEQARAKPLDGRADIYSLGVSMFRTATGQLPFAGDDWYEIARQHVEDPPPDPRTLNPALTDGFAAVVLHCLEKLPDDRPATGETLAQELATLLPSTLQHSAYLAKFSAGDLPTVVVPANHTSGERASATPATPASSVVTRSRARARLFIGSAAGIALIALGAAAIANGPGSAEALDRSADPAATATDPIDSAIAALMDSTGAGTDTTGTDSATTARRDSATRAVATTRARVEITAPAEARLFVAGVPVGVESWDSDTMPPGKYEILARLDAIAGCESADARTTVQLRAGRRAEVALEPRACGRLGIIGSPSGASFTLVAISDGTTRTGEAPDTIVVPLGAYRLTSRVQLEGKFCSAFSNDSVRVARVEPPTMVRYQHLCQTP